MKIIITFTIFVLGCLLSATTSAATFNYLYIEANEGNSSGGHSAIQFGDYVYHYQYIDPGLIRLFRQDPNDFHFSYRYLQNRPIHLSEIEVSEATFNALNDYFQWQFLEQEQHYKHLEAVNKEYQLIRQLLDEPEGDSALRIKGAGLFYPSTHTNRQAPDADLAARQSGTIDQLRHTIEQHHGRDFLLRTRITLEAEIKALKPLDWSAAYPIPMETKRRAPPYSFADHTIDALSGLFAIKILQEAQPLQPDAFFMLDPQTQVLTAAEKKSLLILRKQLETALLQSLNSGRPDWGYAAMINTARYIAVDMSLLRGQWIFINGFSESAVWIEPAKFINDPQQLQQLIDEAKISLDNLRSTLVHSDATSESEYSELEFAANRYAELVKGQQPMPLRFYGQKALPSLSIDLPKDPKPDLSRQQLRAALAELDTYRVQLMDQLKQHYHYDLITRNCVTEIFRSIDSALLQKDPQPLSAIDEVEHIKAISKNRLGGYVTPVYNFIPFVSYQSVLDQYRISRSETLPSYRHQEMNKRYESGQQLLTRLQESNVLSSTLYRYNPDDALFVFFTDDNIPLRPLFGAINTTAGLGQSLLGLLSWPFDSGKNLKSGATGVLMSLPELVFFNMRKGSYPYLPYTKLQ
ncbi:MAG: hypothetical protein KGZ88_11200 [Methylomicrobium sp.]|nr:hypothetical protein [Methylomicrobium sp.]